MAYARYQRDNAHLEGDAKTVKGMKCVYDWLYEQPQTLDTIYTAFGKFPSYRMSTRQSDSRLPVLSDRQLLKAWHRLKIFGKS